MPYRKSMRFKFPAARRRAARRIQSAWRKRRGRRKSTYTSSRNKTSNIRIGRASNPHLSLRTRVKRLEISSAKHYDYMLSRLQGVPITPYGATNGTTTNESFTQMLAIQPRNGDGTIPPVSGSARGTERNTREGMEVFCTKVRLRGKVKGIRPQDVEETKNCVYTFTDAITGTNFEQTWDHRQTEIRAACQSRVHIMVLQDTRPSSIDPTTGLYEPNPLPVNPMNAIQGLYLVEGLTTNNSLETMGMDAALRNYTNNRFKVVHNSTLTFDYLHPFKWFDVTINVNKKLVFKPPDPAVVPQGNSDPVNYNLLFYVSAVPSETQKAESPQFVMNNVAVNPYVPVNLLQQPNLSMLSSRTYFKES